MDTNDIRHVMDSLLFNYCALFWLLKYLDYCNINYRYNRILKITKLFLDTLCIDSINLFYVYEKEG